MDRVLVLAAHTDDGELGCGGSIARFVAEGRRVRVVAFSCADILLGTSFPRNQPEIEMRAAMNILGVSREEVFVHDFPVRSFSQFRQEILQACWELNRDYAPTLVLTHRSRDLHQDHEVIAAESLRAFKRTSVLCYEQPWNTVSMDTQAFVKLTREHMERKIRALECYASQKGRGFLDPEFISGWAKTRGVQVGVEFAECYEVPRLLI